MLFIKVGKPRGSPQMSANKFQFRVSVARKNPLLLLVILPWLIFREVLAFIPLASPVTTVTSNVFRDPTWMPQTATSAAVDVTRNPMFSGSRWECTCYNKTEDTPAECTCTGINLFRVPQDMPLEIQRLTMMAVGVVTLRTNALRNYTQITDLILSDLPKFKTIEEGAFRHLLHLRTIYISNAPALQILSQDTFRGIAQTLKSLRIVNCGLLQVPNLNHLDPDRILTMIDLEGNRISSFDKSITLKTEQLILANNDLTSVCEKAFEGSSIDKLSLKGNAKLEDIHRNAFAGVTVIRELDLSETSVRSIPTEGLDKMEVLRIQNTQSLKIIPSVYNFKNLQEAWLTHPFHCCAFIFPARHDPESYARAQQNLQRHQEQCLAEKSRREQTTTKKIKRRRTTRRETGVPPLGQAVIESSSTTTGIYSPNPFYPSPPTTSSSSSLAGVSRPGTPTTTESFHDRGDNTNQFTANDEGVILGRRNIGDILSGLAALGSEISQHYAEDEEEFDGADDHPLFGLEASFDGSPLYLGDRDQEEVFFDMPFNVGLQFEMNCGNLSVKTQQVKCYPQPDALNPCEDVMGSDWLRVSVWVVVSFTVFGNVSVLVVILSSRSGMSVFKFLISNLAFADLCMGLYLLLIASMDIHSIGEYFNFAFDWQYGIGCRTAGFLTVFATNLSVYTLTVITIERWLTITYAIYLKKRIKLRTAIAIMFGGWAYSIGVAVLPLVGFSNYSSTSICLPMESRDFQDISYLLGLLIVSGLAFVIIAISYTRIYYSLGRETRQAEVAVAKKMVLLVLTNFVCFAPILFFALTAMAGYPLIDVAKSKILLVFFYPLNSCANPYLYAIITTQYRKDLFTLLSKCGLCVKRAHKYRVSYSIPTVNHTTIPLMSNSHSGSLISGGVTEKRRDNSIEGIQQQKKDSTFELKPLEIRETQM